MKLVSEKSLSVVLLGAGVVVMGLVVVLLGAGVVVFCVACVTVAYDVVGVVFVLGAFCCCCCVRFTWHLNETAGWGPSQFTHLSVVVVQVR